MNSSFEKYLLIIANILFIVIWGLFDIEISTNVRLQITTYFSILFVLIIMLNKPIKIFIGNKASLLFSLLTISYLFTTMINFNLIVGNDNFFKIFLIPIGYFFWTSIFYFIQFLIKDERMISKFHIYLKILGLLISFSVVLSYFLILIADISFGESYNNGNYIRAFGPLGDQVGFIILLFVIISYQEKKYLLFIFHLAAVIVTGTKSAIFCSFIGIIIFTFLNIYNSEKISFRKTIFPMIIFVSVLIALFKFNILEEATNRLFDNDDLESSTFQRTTVIGLATESFFESPIWGYGFSGFNKIAIKNDYNRFFMTNNIENDVSNSYYNTNNQTLEVANNGGLISLIIYLSFIFSLFKNWQNLIQNNNKIPFLSYYIYIFCMIIFNQTAVYLINGATGGYLFLLVSGFVIQSQKILFDKKITSLS